MIQNTPVLIGTLLTTSTLLLGSCSMERKQATDEPSHAHLRDMAEPSVEADQAVTDRTMQEAFSALSQPVPFQPRRASNTQQHTMGSLFLPAMEPASEQYATLQDNTIVQTSKEPLSTFSIDVDTGAYSNTRRFLQSGTLPPEDSVRVEELLNYFSYQYPDDATPDTPFSVVTELGPAPWNQKTHLLHIGLKGYTPADIDKRAANLVFLIDVSGSMNSANKLGLLKASIGMLVDELDANDTISMVVYAGSSGVVLEPTAGNRRATILRALATLNAGGSTNGAEGIELAYQLAAEHFLPEGVNRVILATDGDFNVGLSDIDELKRLIGKKRESGIALTTLGFGTGNYNDHLMEQLADTGNGQYAYIDTLSEARKVLVDERHATLLTIAQDVKVQVEFNPAQVSEYRLIGYSNRTLNNEDFNNDRVDAGDIGAGHTVTALYEVALQGNQGERISTGRYSKPVNTPAEFGDEIAQVQLRYKLPDEQDSRLISQIVTTEQSERVQDTSENYRFSASVAAFAQLLRGGQYLEDYDYAQTRELAAGSTGEDRFGYRAEFLSLIDMAASLDSIDAALISPPPPDDG